MSRYGGKRGCCSPPFTSVIYRGERWVLPCHSGAGLKSSHTSQKAPIDGLGKWGVPKEKGVWKDVKEKYLKLHGLSLVIFKELFCQQKIDFTYFLLTDICCGPTSVMWLIQVEISLHLCPKGQVRWNYSDKLSSISQREEAC